MLTVATCVAVAVQPSKSAKSAKKTPPKTSKTAAKKKYVSSAAKKPSKASKVKTAAKKIVTAPKTLVTAKARAAAHEYVYENVAEGADIPVDNAAALIPFFEQLYRHQRGEVAGPVHILHYGDSHTAADEWTGDLRTHFQEKFGDGGSGFSLAGRPWNSYRRMDVR